MIYTIIDRQRSPTIFKMIIINFGQNEYAATKKETQKIGIDLAVLDSELPAMTRSEISTDVRYITWTYDNEYAMYEHILPIMAATLYFGEKNPKIDWMFERLLNPTK